MNGAAMRSVKKNSLRWGAVVILSIAGGAAAVFAESSRERDPFRFGAATPKAGHVDEKPAGPKLEMVIIRDGDGLAVINGRLYRTGDNFEGQMITAITLTEVRVEKEGHTKILKLRKARK